MTTNVPRWRIRRLQITSDAQVAREAILERVSRGGRDFAVQLRDPDLEAGALYEWGRVLRAATRAAGAAFFVNDRVDLALALDADGIHLGRGSVSVAEARQALGQRLITRSAHDDDEIDRAVREGADAVVVSPIFASPGKAAPLGTLGLIRARTRVPDAIAVIALGGVTGENAPLCFAAGADAVAAIRADLSSFSV